LHQKLSNLPKDEQNLMQNLAEKAVKNQKIIIQNFEKEDDKRSKSSMLSVKSSISASSEEKSQNLTDIRNTNMIIEQIPTFSKNEINQNYKMQIKEEIDLDSEKVDESEQLLGEEIEHKAQQDQEHKILSKARKFLSKSADFIKQRRNIDSLNIDNRRDNVVSYKQLGIPYFGANMAHHVDIIQNRFEPNKDSYSSSSKSKISDSKNQKEQNKKISSKDSNKGMPI
jgi:Fe2+ transport system protein B